MLRSCQGKFRTDFREFFRSGNGFGGLSSFIILMDHFLEITILSCRVKIYFKSVCEAISVWPRAL